MPPEKKSPSRADAVAGEVCNPRDASLFLGDLVANEVSHVNSMTNFKECTTEFITNRAFARIVTKHEISQLPCRDGDAG